MEDQGLKQTEKIINTTLVQSQTPRPVNQFAGLVGKSKHRGVRMQRSKSSSGVVRDTPAITPRGVHRIGSKIYKIRKQK